MRHTTSLLSRRSVTFTATLAMAALLIVPAASALEVTFGEPTKAYPQGDPGQVPITITYDCADYLGEDGDITISATVDAGSVEVSPDTIPINTFPAECTTGAQEATATANVTADTSVKAGEAILVTVTATGPDGTESEPKEIEVAVGPFVDVRFQANATSFVLAPGGSTEETITISSDSNDQVMIMTDVTEWPDGWNEPGLPTPTVDAATDGTTTGEVTFDIAVPGDAEPGEYSMIVSLFAHSTKEASVATEPQQLAYIVTVEEAGATTNGGDGDTEESPVPAAPILLAGLLAALVAARRRRD